MSTEALRKAVDVPGFDFTISDGPDTRILTWHKQGCRPAWETECDMWDALATRRDNYNALVIRLGEVTTRLEAADGLLSDVMTEFNIGGMPLSIPLHEEITTHLKAADHV